jgi:CHAP domain
VAVSEPGTLSSALPEELERYCRTAAHFQHDLARWSWRVGNNRRLAYPAFGLQVLSSLSGDVAVRVARVAADFRAADTSGNARVNPVVDLLAVAEEQVGYRETGNNDNKFGEWYGANHDSWCAMFVSWAFAEANLPLPPIQGAKGFAKVGEAFKWGRRTHRLARSPRPGDILLISHDGSKGHTGIVKAVNRDGSITTIEGNTNAQGSRSGDGVYERVRPVATINAGFLRIDGDIAPDDLWAGPDMFPGRSGRTTRKRIRRRRARSRTKRRNRG